MGEIAIRVALGTVALAAALAVTSHSHADDGLGLGGLTLRVIDPLPVPYEATALGRATHSIRFVLTNAGTKTAKIEPLAFRVKPVRDGVVYPCDEPRAADDRWPTTLEPGTSFTMAREVTCDTPLPGHYDVEARARRRSSPEASERAYNTFGIQIDSGPNPPVRLPWNASLFAAASGTKDVRPQKKGDPNNVRIVVAMINGARATRLTLAPVRATMRVTRRNTTTPPCGEQSVDLPFSGSLEPGRSQSLSMPLDCPLREEAVYDVDISVTNAAGTKVHVASHAVRANTIPPLPPAPDDQPRAGERPLTF